MYVCVQVLAFFVRDVSITKLDVKSTLVDTVLQDHFW